MGNQAMLPPTAGGPHFHTIFDTQESNPFLAFMAKGSPDTSGFVAAHGVGYVNELALTGPDRPVGGEVRAGGLPPIPLQGPVVAHNPGRLELYETITRYNSDSAAEVFIRGTQQTPVPVTYNGALMPNRDSMLPLPPGVDGSLIRTTAADSEHETAYRAAIRHGSFVLQLNVQGGAGLGEHDFDGLLARAEATAASACSWS